MAKTFENETTLKIWYHWHEYADNPPREDHAEQLHEAAIARIFEMYPQGYREGELCEIVTDSNDKEFEFRGWWRVTKWVENVDYILF